MKTIQFDAFVANVMDMYGPEIRDRVAQDLQKEERPGDSSVRQRVLMAALRDLLQEDEAYERELASTRFNS